MQGVGYFKCEMSCIESLYSLFDSLCIDYKDMIMCIAEERDVYIRNTVMEGLIINIGDRTFSLRTDVLNILDKRVFVQSKGVVELSYLNAIDFNEAYFFNKNDVSRASSGSINGRYNSHVRSDLVYKPYSIFKYSDICEVRGIYKDYAENNYKEIALGDTLADFTNRVNNNSSYKELFDSYISKGCNVNRLFEEKGNIICKNPKVGYSYLERLQGVESEFYNELLEFVVSLGKPINSVYFYSDLNWSKVLCRESKIPGEYEIVLK